MTDSFNHLAGNDTIKLPSIVWSSGEGAIVYYFKGDEMINSLLLDTLLCQSLLLYTKSDTSDMAPTSTPLRVVHEELESEEVNE
eukprot:CCRYP_010118-RB/>CCRYP_010118-RB protein AED:0.47 eAED:1.00 QI:0/0/0/1/0/0/2/0/83